MRHGGSVRGGQLRYAVALFNRQAEKGRDDFREITDEEVAQAAYRLNHRPQKTLGLRTPHPVFHEEKPH